MSRSLLTALLRAFALLTGLPAQAGDRIDINTAGVEQLQSVRGIGPKTAAAIVHYRSEHGLFEEVDDLEHVKGIGKKKLEAIKDELTVGDAGEHEEK